MPHLLLTNDDGVDSPALLPFARALAAVSDVTAVVPDRERSWIGKAISRIGEVGTRDVQRDGLAITTCTGYPADATQIGVHNICDPPPDLVVSGINLGLNHGTAFTVSSGTVGAAVEGWISGRPAIAFSTGPADLTGAGYRDWRRHVWSDAAKPQWTALAVTCATILTDVMGSGLLEAADVVSVNLPFEASADTPRRLTDLARIRYGALFRPVGRDRYRAGFVDIDEPASLRGTDVEAFRDGAVSITPLRMPAAADVPDELRARVERTAPATT
ncbi:5'/3'-nucleotidase SurE [soil metagenome]